MSVQINPNIPVSPTAMEGPYQATGASVVPGAGFVYLSPEALISFVEQQLNSLDEKIFAHMKEIDQRRKTADSLGEVSGILKECEKAGEGKYLEDLKQKAHGEVTAYQKYNGLEVPVKTHSNTPEGMALLKKQCPGAVIKETKPGDAEAKAKYDQIKQQFQAAAEKLAAAGYGSLAQKCQDIADGLANGKVPSSAAISGLATEVERTMSSLSSSSEMTMIQLQELMQQRSRAVMFATNTMASLNEASRKIIENTR
jgi:hypothetical protein